MKQWIVLVLAGVLLCGQTCGVFAKEKGKKADAAAAKDAAAMQASEKTVTGKLIETEGKKPGLAIVDAKAAVLAILPKAKKIDIDVKPLMGAKVRVVGMALGQKSPFKFVGIKSIEKVN